MVEWTNKVVTPVHNAAGEMVGVSGDETMHSDYAPLSAAEEMMRRIGLLGGEHG